ncbi:D-alanine--D-alanine ligase, partial [Streptomyces sp. DK15]|nr:D-alanine--D-alanine ligase [Streptomyces sp. DK15]
VRARLTEGPVLDLLREADLVFLALHGGWGEDGRVQDLLGAAGLPVVERAVWRPGPGEVSEEVRRLVAAGPVVAKPVADGSS